MPTRAVMMQGIAGSALAGYMCVMFGSWADAAVVHGHEVELAADSPHPPVFACVMRKMTGNRGM